MAVEEFANWVVRVWSQPLSVDEVTTHNGKIFKLINLPFYYVGVLEKVLDNFTDKNIAGRPFIAPCDILSL